MAYCPHCKQHKPEDQFYPGQSYCIPCAKLRSASWGRKNPERWRQAYRRWKLANPERAKAHNRKQNLRRYGITPEQYDELFQKQGGVCAICKQPETKLTKEGGNVRRLSVDHDHVTEEVRGLLCAYCNRFLGVLELKGSSWFKSAQEYLNGVTR